MTIFREGSDAAANISTTYSIGIGDTFLGNLFRLADRDWIEITLVGGRDYDIRLEGDHTNGELRDPYLRLYDQAGSYLGYNDDGGPGLDSLLRVTVETTATYYISAGAYVDADTGRYEITVSDRPSDLAADPSSQARMSVNGGFNNRLETGSDRDWVGVELFQGRTYQIDVSGDGSATELTDPFLRLRQADGTFITGNDNGGSGTDARVTFVAGETGLYFMDVLASNPSETGGYSITVSDTGSNTEIGDDSAEQFDAPNTGGTIYALAGDDTLMAGSGPDLFNGGAGTDVVSFANATGRVMEDLQNDALDFGDAVGNRYIDVEVFHAGRFADQLRGDSAENTFFGGGFSDRLYGRAGNDRLDGETGADALYGNAGADIMTGGGDAAQRDRFIYFRNSDSGVGREERDVITDFAAGIDRIEIGRLDADTGRVGNQNFDWIGRVGFSGAAGELRYFNSAQGNTIVQADVTGNGSADFEIELSGVMTLTAGDFLL